MIEKKGISIIKFGKTTYFICEVGMHLEGEIDFPDSILFFFSGTGNSYDLARQISAGIPRSALIPLAPLAGGFEVPANCRRVGFVFPVYMWGMPLVVRSFVQNLSFAGNPYLFAAVSCAGMPGATLLKLDAILSSKKRKPAEAAKGLSAGFSVTMPGNYIPFYGAWSDSAQSSSFHESSVRARKIARVAREGIILPLEKGGFLGNFILSDVLYPLCSPRIPQMDQAFIVNDQCISCGICEKICPVRNIVMISGRPTWKGKCEQCLACLQWCPREAIDFTFITKGRRRYHHPGVGPTELYVQNRQEPR